MQNEWNVIFSVFLTLSDDENDEKCALSLLALLFAGPKKRAVSGSSAICYIYEKFLVR